MKQLFLEQSAVIKKFEVKTKKVNDEKERSVHIFFTLEGEGEDVLGILGAPDSMMKAVWDEDNGYLRDPLVGKIPFGIEFSEHSVKITGGSYKVGTIGDACTVKSFKVDPSEGQHVSMDFKVICYPDEKQVGQLYMLVDESVNVSIAPIQRDLVEDRGDDTAKAA